MFNPVIFRLFVSQTFLCFLFISITPLKHPIKRNTIIIIIGALLITVANAFVIVYIGLVEFYLRYFFLTLILPYFILLSFFAIHRGPKLIFGILTCEVFGNFAIANGLLYSYLVYGFDNAFADGIVRIITFIVVMPLFLKWVKPMFIRMAEFLDKGWWILSGVLIISYMLTYYISFVPEDILLRPEYFPHVYITILLSGFIYLIIFEFFLEIQSKFETDRDKQLLLIQVNAISNQSETIVNNQEQIRILRHDIRHQLNIIGEYISNGNMEEANKFLMYCQDELNKTTTQIYCVNMAINATLSYYFELAKRNSIKVIVNCDIPQIVNINIAELAVAYANSLENAINACIKEPDESKRFINLQSVYTSNKIVIDMTNNCFSKVKFSNKGIPYTTKKDHGIGILSILAFAKKYDSVINFSQNDDTFNLKLLINLEV